MLGIWIDGFNQRYAATSDGRIFSVTRRGTKGGYLKATPNGKGYLKVQLTRPDGSQVTKQVHILVLEAFAGPRPEGMQACHNNGNKTDNRRVNLRWDTPSANNLDKRQHGTDVGGSRNGRAKLTDQQVIEIRSLYSQGGVSYAEIGRRYGVDKTTIGRVVSGTSWIATMKTKGRGR